MQRASETFLECFPIYLNVAHNLIYSYTTFPEMQLDVDSVYTERQPQADLVYYTVT